MRFLGRGGRAGHLVGLGRAMNRGLGLFIVEFEAPANMPATSCALTMLGISTMQ